MKTISCAIGLAIAAGLLLIGTMGIAQASPCAPTLTAYPPPPDYTATLTCTCGPPRGGILDLSELTESLNPDAPEPFEGTFQQQIGGVIGSWTYADTSNICFAAQHAGLIPDPDFGAEITVSVSAGCQTYEGSVHNRITTHDGGPRELSFYFSKVSDGTCPGENGHVPDRVQLGQFGDGWTAVTYPRDNGEWGCLAYERARDAETGLWLYAYPNHIRYAPNAEIDEESRVVMTIDDVDFPMALRNGYAYIPTSIGPVGRRLAGGTEMAVTVTPEDGPAATHHFSLAGLTDVYRRMAQECGFDASDILGDEG